MEAYMQFGNFKLLNVKCIEPPDHILLRRMIEDHHPDVVCCSFVESNFWSIVNAFEGYEMYLDQSSPNQIAIFLRTATIHSIEQHTSESEAICLSFAHNKTQDLFEM